MSDPAIEAARRTLDRWTTDGWNASRDFCAEAAAREALAPLRELHQRKDGICIECWWSDGTPRDWPCSTARLIYPSEELT